MKKIISIIVTLCLFIGISGATNNSVYAKEKSEEYTIETKNYSEQQQEQLKQANYVFSQEELKGTQYAGQKVEIIEGTVYVDGKSIWTIIIWFYVHGVPKIAGWMAAGGVIKAADNYIIKSELRSQLKMAWNRFGNDMTDAYAEDQKLKSVKLSNGNQCVLAPGGNQFHCMYAG